DGVAAGGLVREEVVPLDLPVFVVALLRRADAAERRRPGPAAGGDIAQQRAEDLVARVRAAADDGEVLLAPLPFEDEVARQRAAVVKRVKRDRIADRAKALQVDDVAEFRAALVVFHFQIRADDRV